MYRAVDQASSEAYETLSNSLNDSSSAAGWSCSVAVKVVSKKDVDSHMIEREVEILTACAHPSVLLIIKHIQTGKPTDDSVCCALTTGVIHPW